MGGWMERDRQDVGGEIERQLERKGRQHRFKTNTGTVLFHNPAEAESQRSDATHNLTHRSQNITCSLAAVGQLHTCFTPSPRSRSPVRLCDGAYADHSPRLYVVHVAVRQERHAGKPGDADQSVLGACDH